MRLLRERIRTNMRQCDRVSKIPKEMKWKNMPAVWPSLSPKSFVCGFPFVLWRLRELWVVVFDRFFVFSFVFSLIKTGHTFRHRNTLHKGSRVYSWHFSWIMQYLFNLQRNFQSGIPHCIIRASDYLAALSPTRTLLLRTTRSRLRWSFLAESKQVS